MDNWVVLYMAVASQQPFIMPLYNFGMASELVAALHAQTAAMQRKHFCSVNLISIQVI